MSFKRILGVSLLGLLIMCPIMLVSSLYGASFFESMIVGFGFLVVVIIILAIIFLAIILIGEE